MEKYYLNIKINEKIHITLSHFKPDGSLHKTNQKFDIRATKYKSVFHAVYEALQILERQTERPCNIDVSISEEYTYELFNIIKQDHCFDKESSPLYLDTFKKLLKRHTLQYVKNINYPSPEPHLKPPTITGSPKEPKQPPQYKPINSQCKNCIYYNTEEDEGTCSQYDKNKQNCPDYRPSYIHNNKSYKSKKIIIQPKKAR